MNVCTSLTTGRGLRVFWKSIKRGFNNYNDPIVLLLCRRLYFVVQDQLVIRIAYAETPPKVEYHLSPKGKELVPLLKGIAKWGKYLVEK